tara:strand:+ start:588 stop:767 length:180 start_codon:yes stop_codon:yes gene_type:complete
MEDQYLECLLARLGLELSDEEIRWVKTAFAGYHSQIEELMSLDLAGEEVGTAFLPLGKP